MTFSRRAAVEMKRRIERIAGAVLGDKAATLTAGLTWAGTFHSVSARILRDHAAEIGLDPAFTIHDRSDSADLMNMVRHRLGLSRPRAGSPKGHVPRDLRGGVLASSFPMWIGWAAELKRLFAGYVEAKQKAQLLDYDDLLLYWAEMLSDPAAAARSERVSTMSSSTSIRTPIGCRRRSCSG